MDLSMRQSQVLGLRQTQQLVMTPAMVQAIKLLQLNTMELEQEVQRELEENPFLEIADEEEDSTEKSTLADNGRDSETIQLPQAAEPNAPEPDPHERDNAPGASDLLVHPDQSEQLDPEVDEYYTENYSDSYYATAERDSQDSDFTEYTPAGTTLYDYLARQLHVSKLEQLDQEIGEYLIGNIDDDGYLRVTVKEVAERFGVEPKRVESVLKVIQTFDPPGVGARDLRECLLIQIRLRGTHDELLEKLVQDHFDDLCHRRFKNIARQMHIPERRVAELSHIILGLEPKPGRVISSESTVYITPDVIVDKIDGKYHIYLNEGITNHLKISSYYRNYFRNALHGGRGGENKPETEYIRKKYNDAVTLIRNIEKRKGTILKITRSIMEKQRDFLEKGIEGLKPMTLKDIAQDVGMHEATVSRVTSNKYVQTPRGTFLLKFFFSSGLETDSGDNASSRSIRNKIRELIENEDPKKPLSDQKIADILKDQGYHIARRTVTKYRKQMKILPTNMRKAT